MGPAAGQSSSSVFWEISSGLSCYLTICTSLPPHPERLSHLPEAAQLVSELRFEPRSLGLNQFLC